MLQINSEKMSKSLGNFLLLRDILKETEPAVLRMLMLQTHYRSPLDFSNERLSEAQSALGRIQNFLQNAEWLCETASKVASGESFNTEAFNAAQATMQNDFVEAMDDDFNTAGALGTIFSFVSEANTLLSEVVLTTSDAASLDSARQKVVELMGVLGIALTSEEQQEEGSEELLSFAMEAAGYTGSNSEEAIRALLDCRAAARKEKNFALADRVRDGLAELGYVIEDTPQGARVRRK